MACQTVPYLSTSAHKRNDFRKKIWAKLCVFVLSATSYLTFHILGIVQRGISINVHRYSNKAPVIFAGFS